MIRSTIVIVSSRSMAPAISDTIGFLVVPIVSSRLLGSFSLLFVVVVIVIVLIVRMLHVISMIAIRIYCYSYA